MYMVLLLSVLVRLMTLGMTNDIWTLIVAPNKIGKISVGAMVSWNYYYYDSGYSGVIVSCPDPTLLEKKGLVTI